MCVGENDMKGNGKMRRALLILLALIVSLLLCSCAFVGIIYPNLYSDETKVKMDEADEFTQEFLSLISSGDILEAEEYMHPQFFKQNGNLIDYLSGLEKNESIDFSQGVLIERTVSKNKSSDYFFPNGYTYHGYTIEYDILIGDVNKTCKISICDDDNGYGIYQIIFID